MTGAVYSSGNTSGKSSLRRGFRVDSTTTAVTLTTGKAPDNGKTLTFEGKMDDPMTGRMDNTCRFIDRVVSKDDIHQEIHDLSPGKDSKMMESVYNRKK